MRSRIVQALLLAQSVTESTASKSKDDTYDYVVVGGGVSGLVVANRLTEDKNGRSKTPLPNDRLLNMSQYPFL